MTRPLTSGVDLLSLTDPASPLVWLRGDRGAIGVGEALRLTFRGPTRFRDAAAAWQRVTAQATVDDPVGVPGTGLVAFGAFSFADGSDTESTLIVPRTLVAQHRDVWWVTTVHDAASEAAAAAWNDPDQPAHMLPEATAPGAWPGVEFADLTSQTAASVAAYLAGVAEADERIARGELEKIVVARQVRGELAAGADLRTPIARLANRYLDCWTFAVDGLVGASPETLVRSTSGSVSARVLAGTRGRHPESAERDARARDELLTSSKEQHEHAFAVQSVVTALAPHVTDLRTNEEPFALELPNVWHLATDLGASLGEAGSSLELVDALHPTAAVAGTPTRDAIDAIDEIEPFDRGRYSGAVGWIDQAGDGEWAIALRCAQLNDKDAKTGTRQVVASAGGGIVAGSDPAGELRETVSKFRPITEAFAK